MRYFFEISYTGTHFHGWQSQANAIGVQQVVEKVLSKLFRREIKIIGSGRTDAGVHCVQQFFHADLSEKLNEPIWIQKLNSFLPKQIAISSIRSVRADAHARYDAIERSYLYKLTTTKNPFLQGYSYHYFKKVNVKTMQRASSLLLGTHDFECFSKVKTDVNHFMCSVKKAVWKQEGELLIFSITSNRFLRGMVRAIIGTLLDVGTGKISVEDFEEIVESKNRKNAGMNVPAEGLYLVGVKYPKKIFIS